MSAGWYKLQPATRDEPAQLFYGPNFVVGPGFELRTTRTADRDNARGTRDGVHGGWHWFDSEADARAKYGIEIQDFEYDDPRKVYNRKPDLEPDVEPDVERDGG